MIDAIGSSGTYLNKVDPNTVQRRPPRPNLEDLDVNGDSTLDKSELQVMLDKIAEKTGTTMDSEKVFSLVDSNKDGAINQSEFNAGEKKVRDLIGPPPMKNHAKGGKKSGDFSDLILGLLNDDPTTSSSVNSEQYTSDLLRNSLLSNYTNSNTNSNSTNSLFDSQFPLDLMA